MTRQRGIVQAIRELRGALPRVFTISDAERLLKKRGWVLNRDQVRNAVTRMSEDGSEYQELDRGGKQRHRTYSFLEDREDATRSRAPLSERLGHPVATRAAARRDAGAPYYEIPIYDPNDPKEILDVLIAVLELAVPVLKRVSGVLGDLNPGKET